MPRKADTPFKIGDRVRVKRFRTVARIVYKEPGSYKGDLAIQLDRRIDGFSWWGTDALVHAAPGKGKNGPKT
jgi:hypothetical protein